MTTEGEMKVMEGTPNPAYRIGLIVPSSNTTIETEVPEMLARRREQTGERFTFHSSRAVLHNVDAESLDRMVQDSDRCAGELADARVDAIAYACLIALMARGAGAHEEVEARVAGVAAGAGAPDAVITSSAGALVRSLEALGARRVAIVTPYMPPLTKMAADYLESYGVTVTASTSLGVSDNIAVARLDPAGLPQIARDLDTSDADAVILSACVQMPSLSAIEPVEQELGLPVLSAATATVHDLLTRLGIDPVVPGAGALLSGQMREPTLD
jgi:maleate isomerase